MGVFLRRYRQCFNDHRFMTYEVFAGNLDRRGLTATVRGIAARIQAAKIKRTVLANPSLTATSLAVKLNITEARVRQIRNEAQALPVLR